LSQRAKTHPPASGRRPLLVGAVDGGSLMLPPHVGRARWETMTYCLAKLISSARMPAGGPDMKGKTPLITLLTGAALGAVLLVASMLATPKAPAAPVAAATPAPASSATQPAPASPTPTATAVANVPARANYAGEVNGGGASVAISIHRGQAIAYVCNG